MNFLNQCFAGITLLLSASQMVFAGEGAHGGGNPVMIRKSQIIQELKQLPNYMKIVANPIVGSALLKNSSEKIIYTDIIKRDFLTDLVSPYKIVDSKLGTGECLLNGIRVPATSKMGDLRGEICFDVELLLNLNTTLAELIGLAFHEYAHHFNYLDQDHALAAAIAEAYISTLPNAAGITNYGGPYWPYVCIDPDKHPQIEIVGVARTRTYASTWCTPSKTYYSSQQRQISFNCFFSGAGDLYLKSISGDVLRLYYNDVGTYQDEKGKQRLNAGLANINIVFSKDCRELEVKTGI